MFSISAWLTQRWYSCTHCHMRRKVRPMHSQVRSPCKGLVRELSGWGKVQACKWTMHKSVHTWITTKRANITAGETQWYANQTWKGSFRGCELKNHFEGNNSTKKLPGLPVRLGNRQYPFAMLETLNALRQRWKAFFGGRMRLNVHACPYNLCTT